MINVYKSDPAERIKLVESFLNNEKSRNKSPKTLISYRADLSQFYGWMMATKRLISEINPNDISEYGKYLSGQALIDKPHSSILRQWKDKFVELFKLKRADSKSRLLESPTSSHQRAPLRHSSRRRHFTALKMFFQFLIESEQRETLKIKKNPVMSALHSIKLKDIDVEHTKNITPAEYAILLKKNKSIKSQFILNLLYFGGLRLAELCSLKVESFDHGKQTIKLIRKGGSIQFLKIQNADLIFKLFDQYCYSFNIDKGWLFFDRFSDLEIKNHVSERSMYGTIKRILIRSLPTAKGLGPHSFRKACASELYRLTKDLLLVRNYLNHKDAKVTQTYIDYEDHHS